MAKSVDKAPEDDTHQAGLSRGDESPKWRLFFDGSSTSEGCDMRLILTSPDGYKTSYDLSFGFQALNDETEYEAMLAGQSLAKELWIDHI